MLKTLIATAAVAIALAVPASAQDAPAGALMKTSSMSVSETVDAFLAVLGRKGATVFAIVDHAKGAASVDMEIKPATLVIFGNPKLGTPLMQAAPSMAVAVPLRAAFIEGEDGKTHIVYTDIAKIAEDHGIDPSSDAVQNVAKALNGLTNAVAE